MSEPRKHHLVIDGAQVKEDEQNIGLYKAIPENDTDFRTSKSSLHKSREKASIDGAEEKLLSKEDEAKIVTRVDMADAKYVVGDHRNGDAKIELDANKRQFTGLTKEELLKYADDPFWVRLRWFMFVLFWALWLAMLAGAIAIIVTAPKCAAPEPKAWFEKGPIIDMEKGLSEISSSDLEKLKEINPEAIYVDVDTPYDILDSGADVAKFKDIIAQAKDVKVILDMSLTSVPTSHRWFSLSANRTPEYETYFIWASPKEYNGTEPLPPNKWVSTFNTSAWRWSDARSQFYLQQTTAGEADLNLTDARVRAQAGDVIAKWIGLGAAGIRLVNARELLIDPTLADEVPASGAAARASDHTQYGFWRHARASDQPGLAQLLAEWASVVRTSAKTDYPAVLTTEERGDRPEYFLSVHNNTSALRPRTARVVLGTDSAAAAKAIGDRLGTWPALKLWSPSNNSELAAWSLLLPATPVLTLRDFTVQNNSDGESLVHLLRLRSDVSVQHGEFIVSAVPARNRSDTLLAVARWKAGHTGYAGVYNPLPTAARADLRSLRSVPDTVSVLYVSADVRADTNYTTNLSIPSDDVLVPSQSSVLLSYVPVITPVE